MQNSKNSKRKNFLFQGRGSQGFVTKNPTNSVSEICVMQFLNGSYRNLTNSLTRKRGQKSPIYLGRALINSTFITYEKGDLCVF